MSIQERKLHLIEELIGISDESFLIKLESFINNEKPRDNERVLQPMTLSQFNEMIDKAMQDKREGRVVSHEELKNRVKLWK